MSSLSALSGINRRKFLLGGAAAMAAVAGLGAIPARAEQSNAKIVITGAGAAGISIANRLAKALPNANITIIDRRETHYYWPGLTLVATGAWAKSKVLDRNASFMPSRVNWIKEMADVYEPDNKRVITDTGRVVEYDFLVVASGVEYNYDAIEGMDVNAIGQNGLASVYNSPDAAAKTWDAIRKYSVDGGNGIFTLPSTPIRCAGAPLKMTLLTLDRLQQNGGADKAQMSFYSALNGVFGLPWYNDFLLNRFAEHDMDVKFRHELSAVDIGARKATFTQEDGNQFTTEYDLLHVVPPMRAPRSVRESNLAWTEGNMAAGGWLAVDRDTLQHLTYPEVFGCGDVNGTPRGKTAATVKMSVPIVVQNLISVIAGEEPEATFDGYTSCPLLTRFGAAMLIEFDYDGNLTPTYSFIDPKKESWFAWIMKDQMLKPTYLQMLKGNV
ncbi:NAD(P)/FAD-dependent oxidoreductase [Thiomicrospira sp. ALE5]|uniref:NAD(P)/FAD-dependent oxidoreductase n=1 Tax=Thiomicrospira sp. ALE5 TaxID=748650 RepID=UPI0008E0ABC0|nr:FAD/NAD(P)-binding oxidoreductase [Thiomicrospira sp. ALE5]SFR64059.1 sulfide:quinone oxidoreductase [Thiomicrospira sp. ALE5]